MSVRVRFAPSPTGQVHIGNIRAAIFNLLFARHSGGSFLLRIEDTDRERSTPEACESLLQALEWLGMSSDEPVLYQSTRCAAHLSAAEELLDKRAAYRKPAVDGSGPGAVFFRIPRRLDAIPFVRETGPAEIVVHPDVPVNVADEGVSFAQVSRKGKAIPSGCCLAGMAGLRLFAGAKCVFSLNEHEPAVDSGEVFSFEGIDRMSFVRHEIYFNDAIKGELAKPLDGMKDLVIVRSDGNPVFHLANVCDDAFQKITHIIRGDDHVENTFRHLLLMDALGYSAPVYAHLPMIVNTQGKPYSKRDGDAYVGDFREHGFCADALFNYLSLLGWSPGEDREKMTRDEMISSFSLERVKSAAAQMDLRKLTHMNWMYICEMPLETFVNHAWDALKDQLWRPDFKTDYFKQVCKLMQSRVNVFSDVNDWRYFFDEEAPVDQAARNKFLNLPGVTEALTVLRKELENCGFTEADLLCVLRKAETETGMPEGKLNQPVRIAVTGVTRGAGIYETMSVMGRERVLQRMDKNI